MLLFLILFYRWFFSILSSSKTLAPRVPGKNPHDSQRKREGERKNWRERILALTISGVS